MPMKIAITSLYLPSGSKIGVGYQVHNLANELVRRGHTVTVFSQSGASVDSLYNVEVVPSGRRLRTFGFAWALRRYDFSKFDVLNAHGDDWFLWGCKRPRHIHTYHGSCLAEMLNAKDLTTKARMAMLAACEYNSLMLADERVAVSDNTRKYIPFIRHVIPCGVDLKTFSPGTEKSAEPTLLFVGTMHGRKRGAMLLDLFLKQIKPAIPTAQFWAVCENKIEGDGVHWFGRVPTDELIELYRKAWVFCLPSTYEGFGVPYIEAMATGTPVVASPNVGAVEVLQGGNCGMLASDDKLAKTLIETLTNESLRSRLRDAGLRRSKDFSWDTICAKYEALYLLSPSPGTPASGEPGRTGEGWRGGSAANRPAATNQTQPSSYPSPGVPGEGTGKAAAP
jgi:glycosyltransferase involved in cell wall biosynthesis